MVKLFPNERKRLSKGFGGFLGDLNGLRSGKIQWPCCICIPPDGALPVCAPTPLTVKSMATLPALSNSQRCLHVLTFLERFIQPDEHHMVAARAEFDRLSRLDLKTFVDGTHFHHAVVQAHLMYFEAAGDVR